MARAVACLLAALLLSAGSLTLLAAPTVATSSTAGDAGARHPLHAAEAFLRSQLRADGSISGSFQWEAVLAFAALGVDPREVRRASGEPTVMDRLAQEPRTKTLDWENGILAIVAAGEDPHSFRGIDYVEQVRGGFVQGQFGNLGWLNDDIFAILSLRSAGIAAADYQIQAARALILANQNPDGGWANSGNLKGTSGADMTGAAVAALILAGEAPGSDAVERALAYLRTQQVEGGAFRSDATPNPNIYSTAWALQGLRAAGADPASDGWRVNGSSPIDYLWRSQLPGGAFPNGRGNPDGMATAQAVVALASLTYPVPAIRPLALQSGTLRVGSTEGARVSFLDGEAPARAVWRFADGSEAEGAALPRTFAAPGEYRVEVAAFDAEGRRGFASALLTVLNPPVAALALSRDTVHRNETVTVDASASLDPAGGALEFRFEFGDGATTGWTPDPVARHAFDGPGAFTITVEARAEDGALARATREMVVLNRAPTVAIQGPREADRVTPARFQAVAVDPEGDALTFRWVIGDSEAATGDAADLVFAALGSHTVRLVVEDAYSASAEAIHSVQVVNRPPVLGNVTLNATPVAGREVTFEAQVHDPEGAGVVARWRLEGGPSGHGAAGGFLVPDAATFRLTVTATDADGAAVTRVFTFEVGNASEPTTPTAPEMPAASPAEEPVAPAEEAQAAPEQAERAPPVVVLATDRREPLVGEPVTFRAQAQGADGGPVAYTFTLDGTRLEASGDRLVHAFLTPGFHVVEVVARDATGAAAAATAEVLVREAPPPSLRGREVERHAVETPQASEAPEPPEALPAAAQPARAETPGVGVAFVLAAAGAVALAGRWRGRR